MQTLSGQALLVSLDPPGCMYRSDLSNARADAAQNASKWMAHCSIPSPDLCPEISTAKAWSFRLVWRRCKVHCRLGLGVCIVSAPAPFPRVNFPALSPVAESLSKVSLCGMGDCRDLDTGERCAGNRCLHCGPGLSVTCSGCRPISRICILRGGRGTDVGERCAGPDAYTDTQACV